MKVVFLDVDGVLNSEAFLRKLEARHDALGAHRCACFRHDAQIDDEAVERLNRIVHATEAVIVVSSSWRKLLDPPDLHRILRNHGLRAVIVGETPETAKDPDLLAEVGERVDRYHRGHEIDAWLRRHPQVDRFVILDDGSDMVMHKNRLVQTDCMEGLLDEHVEFAIKLLSWDGKTSIPVVLADEEKTP